jgi:hypothetical protein
MVEWYHSRGSAVNCGGNHKMQIEKGWATRHTINFDQAALFDSPKNAGGMTSAGLVGHETLEAYDESKGYSRDEGHNYAASLGFPGLGSGSSITAQVQGGMVIGVTANFQLQGTSTTERIQTRYLTPIPLSEFLKKDFSGAPAYPVDVEKK